MNTRQGGDQQPRLKAIKSKNLSLSNDFKVNIIRELSNNKKLPIHSSISQARINSQEVKKNDIFFAIKGKKIDANNFVAQAFKKKASLAIVNRIQSSLNKNKQINRNSEDFLHFNKKGMARQHQQ